MAENYKTGTAPAATGPKDAFGTVRDKTREITAGAADAAGAVKDKAKDLVSTATDKVKDAATAAGDFAVQAKDKVQEWSAAAAHKAGDVVEDAAEELTKLLRRYPIQSVLVGVAIGYLVARATSRS